VAHHTPRTRRAGLVAGAAPRVRSAGRPGRSARPGRGRQPRPHGLIQPRPAL